MLKVGIIGLGHLGTIHLQQWLTLPGVEIIGIFDIDYGHAQKVAEQFKVKAFENADLLIQLVDALDIVTPTVNHFEWAKLAITQNKHVFIEKPMTEKLEEAEKLVDLVHEYGIKCQIGHVERYNPAILSLKEHTLNPLFIESHRLSPFNPRGTDVSVIMDLMIHDIDILLHLVPSEVQSISANGVAVLSDSPDIANARIEFENGCVANLTSSRISMKKMRKMRLFQKDAYIGIDFLQKKSEVIRLKDNIAIKNPLDFEITLPNGEQKTISVSQPNIQETNAIQQELADFTLAILSNQPVKVSAEDGMKAIKVAYQVLNQIQHHLEFVAPDFQA